MPAAPPPIPPLLPLRSLEATGLLTQDTEPGGTTLVDACNGFNDLSHLEMLWMARHCWPAGVVFAFNFYRHWAQIILRQPCDAPFILLIQEGVTQGDPLLMFLYGITLVPLSDELRDADSTLLSTF